MSNYPGSDLSVPEINSGNWDHPQVDDNFTAIFDRFNEVLEGHYETGISVTQNGRLVTEHIEDTNIHGILSQVSGFEFNWYGSYTVQVIAEKMMMSDGETILSDINLRASILGVGAGGVDAAGGVDVEKWHAVYLTHDLDEDESALVISESFVQPIMPEGHTLHRFVGFLLTNQDATNTEVVPFIYIPSSGLMRLYLGTAMTTTVHPLADSVVAQVFKFNVPNGIKQVLVNVEGLSFATHRIVHKPFEHAPWTAGNYDYYEINNRDGGKGVSGDKLIALSDDLQARFRMTVGGSANGDIFLTGIYYSI